MKDILIVYNAQMVSENFLWQYNSFSQGALINGFNPILMPTSNLLPIFGKNKYDFSNVEFCIFLDKDINTAYYLENMGVKVFNCAKSIYICDDKSITYNVLCKNKIPIPFTICAPKIYAGTVDNEVCINAASKIGYPLIVKECFGSFGMQVHLAKNEYELLECAKNIGSRPFLFQEYLSAANGWDIRVIVSNNEIIGSIKRINTNDFRSNAAIGGKIEAYELSEEQKELSISAAKATGVTFAGIDLIYNGHEFVVCEVNSNMHFKAASETITTNIAVKITKDLLICCLNK